MTDDERAERLRRLTERRAASGAESPGNRVPEGAAPPPAPRPRKAHPAGRARVAAVGAGATLLAGLVGWMAGYDTAAASTVAEPQEVVVVVRRSATPAGGSQVVSAVAPQQVAINAAPAARTHGSR